MITYSEYSIFPFYETPDDIEDIDQSAIEEANIAVDSAKYVFNSFFKHNFDDIFKRYKSQIEKYRNIYLQLCKDIVNKFELILGDLTDIINKNTYSNIEEFINLFFNLRDAFLKIVYTKYPAKVLDDIDMFLYYKSSELYDQVSKYDGLKILDRMDGERIKNLFYLFLTVWRTYDL